MFITLVTTFPNDFKKHLQSIFNLRWCILDSMFIKNNQHNYDLSIFVSAHFDLNKLPIKGYYSYNTQNSSVDHKLYSDLCGMFANLESNAKIKGTAQYRRYLVCYSSRLMSYLPFMHYWFLWPKSKINLILKDYDFISSEKTLLTVSIYDQFNTYHSKLHMDMFISYLELYHNEYYDSAMKILWSNEIRFHNLIIASEGVYDDYVNTLFDVLQGYSNFLNSKNLLDSPLTIRIFGYIAERFQNIYEHHKNLKVYSSKVRTLKYPKDIILDLKTKIENYMGV